MTQSTTPLDLTPEQDALATLLRWDYRPSDLGDTDGQFEGRLRAIVVAALARETASAAQREAGARYLLVSAQIRETLRGVEEQKSASGSSIRQDLATKLAALRLDQQAQERASGLGVSATVNRARSVSVSVEAGF